MTKDFFISGLLDPWKTLQADLPEISHTKINKQNNQMQVLVCYFFRKTKKKTKSRLTTFLA